MVLITYGSDSSPRSRRTSRAQGQEARSWHAERREVKWHPPRRTRRINAVTRDDDEGGRAARRTRRSPDTSAQQAHEPTKKQHQKHDTHTAWLVWRRVSRLKVRRGCFGGVVCLCCRWAAGTRCVFGGQQGFVCVWVCIGGGAVKWGCQVGGWGESRLGLRTHRTSSELQNRPNQFRATT